ncbi:MAG: hypothetical protein HY790_09240 [Deltaproteobacteria bacterium]|nr:hypothetical protein [Deltaproteobacteria bacterium]
MKTYLPAVLTLLLGVVVMAGLLVLGAMSQNWVAPVCYLAAAVVYYGWYSQLLLLARRVLGINEEDDDQPFFPG